MHIPFLSTVRLQSWRLGPRLPLAIGVLLLSAAIAITGDSRLLLAALAGIVGISLAFMIVRAPLIGLIAIVPLSLVVPLGFGTGSATRLGINLVLLGALTVIWLMRALNRPDEGLLPASKPVFPLMALCGIAILTFVVGQLPWFAFAEGAPLRAQLGGLGTFLLSAAIFLLAATQIRTLAGLKLVTWLFAGIGGVVVVSKFFNEILDPLIARGATGSLFYVWLSAIAVSQGIFNHQLSRFARTCLLLLAAAIFYINIFHTARWASGWIPPLVGVFALIWVGSPRIGAIASIGGLIAAFTNPARAIGLVIVGDNQYSLLTRLEAWRIVGEIVKVNPLIGLGPANYYWYAPLFPILGYSVRFSSHNNYVDIVAQTGLLGLAFFLWFMIAIARVGWTLLSKVPEGFARAYVIGVIGGLAGTLVAGMLGDWVIPFVYNVGLQGLRASLLGWMFLGGLLALEQMTRRGSFEGIEVAG